MSGPIGNHTRQVAPPGFAWRHDAGTRSLVCAALSAFAPHRFTTRELEFRGAGVDRDYARLAATMSVDVRQIARVRQVHGKVVFVAGADTPLEASGPDADAVVVTGPGMVASVRVADCVPILIADRQQRIAAAVHAGWRGTAAGVAAATIQAIRRLGVEASDLVAAIGPSIGPCCYQVDGAVRDAFEAAQPTSGRYFTSDGDTKWKLDLWAANREQLLVEGVPPASIDAARSCTADNLGDWYSYRAEGAATGRMVAAIRLVL